jgi:hypothetical protein
LGRSTHRTAPAYIGVVVFFWELAVFIDERKIKYVFLTGAITALMLSWGKTSYIDRFFIDYIPMYNKFRAVSSIQDTGIVFSPVLPGLQSFFKLEKNLQWKAKQTGSVVLGLIIVFVLSKHVQFSLLGTMIIT